MITSKLFRSASLKKVLSTNISYFVWSRKVEKISALSPALLKPYATPLKFVMSQASDATSSTVTNGTDPASSGAENIVWIDMEMTGLDPDLDHVLEVACVITDGQLNVLAKGPNIVVNQPEEVLNNMNAWSTVQHAQSGLTQRCKESPVSLADAEKQLLEFVRTWTPFNTCPLGGNTVYMDRFFLKKHLPEFERHMHYRLVDVSSVKELCRRWYPDIYRLQPNKKELSKHRALEDILASIEELKFYREKVFKQPEVGAATGMSWC